MTVQIQRHDIIAGLPALEIRRFFRHVKGWHRGDFSKKWIMEYLVLSDWKATQVIRSLIREGYVQRNGKRGVEAVFGLTARGSSLVRASGARRVGRKTAEEALHAFMVRVQNVNENPNLFYTVTAVVVFGSYLKNVGNLGDLDLAVRLESRIRDSDQRVIRELEYARSSAVRFPGSLIS